MNSEKSKMVAGELYSANDPELVEARIKTRRILKRFNDSDPSNLVGRTEMLQELLAKVGAFIEIEPPFRCDYGWNISIGNKFYANFNCIILDVAPVIIGENVCLGPNVQIYTATHPIISEERNKGLESGKQIVIEDNVWIGGGAILNPGVTIGEGTTIGAGSVVTKNIPARVFAAGNPCRIIRQLS